MPSRLIDPDYWYGRADEARAQATEFRDPQARQTMLGIAASYDLMAEQAAARLKLVNESPHLQHIYRAHELGTSCSS